ncbi:MAG: hypothetical protein EOM24_19030 [Chloroflexia bacterium]|nr:hypothetical protein [Chloroflexia bacterium]
MDRHVERCAFAPWRQAVVIFDQRRDQSPISERTSSATAISPAGWRVPSGACWPTWQAARRRRSRDIWRTRERLCDTMARR